MRRVACTAVMLGALAAATAAGAAPTAVSTSLTPRWLFFADRVTAHVDVLFDERRLDPASVRLETSFAPWEQIDRTRVVTTTDGTTAHRSWTFTLACLAIDCVPRGTTPQRFHVPAVKVTAEARDGTSVVIRHSWPILKIAGRFLPTSTPGLRPVFRVNAAPPAATYRVAPGALTLALALAGSLLVAAALALALVEARRWQVRRRTVAAPPPLVRALALLREAQNRDPDDRRRAAGLVARTLARTRNGLASDAARVAWSPDEPAPDRLERLARDVESELEEAT